MVSTASPRTRVVAPVEPSRTAMWWHLVQFHRDPLAMYRGPRDRYGDVILFRSLRGLPWLFVAHPDAVEHVHQRNHKNYGPGRLNEPFMMMLGEGLRTAEREV